MIFWIALPNGTSPKTTTTLEALPARITTLEPMEQQQPAAVVWVLMEVAAVAEEDAAVVAAAVAVEDAVVGVAAVAARDSEVVLEWRFPLFF